METAQMPCGTRLVMPAVEFRGGTPFSELNIALAAGMTAAKERCVELEDVEDPNVDMWSEVAKAFEDAFFVSIVLDDRTPFIKAIGNARLYASPPIWVCLAKGSKKRSTTMWKLMKLERQSGGGIIWRPENYKEVLKRYMAAAKTNRGDYWMVEHVEAAFQPILEAFTKPVRVVVDRPSAPTRPRVKKA